MHGHAPKRVKAHNSIPPMPPGPALRLYLGRLGSQKQALLTPKPKADRSLLRAKSSLGLSVRWIEQRFPKPRVGVRVSPGPPFHFNKLQTFSHLAETALWGLLWGASVHFGKFRHNSNQLATASKLAELKRVAGLSAFRPTS